MGTVAAMPQKKGRKTSASRLRPIKISQKIFFSNARSKNIVRLLRRTRVGKEPVRMTEVIPVR